jgi:mRNA interferase RelE/StbE
MSTNLYNVRWKRSAVKDLRQLPKEIIIRVLRAVEALPNNPFPSGVRKLAGTDHTYRLRESSYRIIYSVLPTELIIEVIRVGHRKDVYDR